MTYKKKFKFDHLQSLQIESLEIRCILRYLNVFNKKSFNIVNMC